MEKEINWEILKWKYFIDYILFKINYSKTKLKNLLKTMDLIKMQQDIL